MRSSKLLLSVLLVAGLLSRQTYGQGDGTTGQGFGGSSPPPPPTLTTATPPSQSSTRFTDQGSAGGSTTPPADNSGTALPQGTAGRSNTPPVDTSGTTPPQGTATPPADSATPPAGTAGTSNGDDPTPSQGPDLAITRSDQQQPLPRSVTINNVAIATSTVVVQNYNTLVTSGSTSSVRTACQNFGQVYQAAVSSRATVSFYKTTSVNVIEFYVTRVDLIVIQFNQYLQVGGSALVAWQGTMGYLCVFPDVSSRTVDFLTVLGSRCQVETSITEVFVSIYLSLGRNDRIKFVATIRQVNTLVVCINSSPRLTIKIATGIFSSGRRMLEA